MGIELGITSVYRIAALAGPTVLFSAQDAAYATNTTLGTDLGTRIMAL